MRVFFSSRSADTEERSHRPLHEPFPGERGAQARSPWRARRICREVGLRAPACAGEPPCRREAVGFAHARLPPLPHGKEREKRPAPSRASCKRRVLRGSRPARAFIVAGRLMPQEAPGAEAAFGARRSMRSRLGRTPGYLPVSAWHGRRQAGAGLVDDRTRTSLRMPARRPFGRSPVPWPRRRPIPLDRRRDRGRGRAGCPITYMARSVKTAMPACIRTVPVSAAMVHAQSNSP